MATNTWVIGARPRTLPAAIAPVVVGTVLAGSGWNLGAALLALLVSLALQVGVNYANDYSDGVRGTDADRVGPVRITAAGLATPSAVKRAAFISFGVAALAGLTLAFLSSFWILIVGVAAIAAAWGYTGGSNPYGYRGLGEISVFIFFGVVATVGTFYVQTSEVTSRAIAASVPMGALACAMLAINNLRDREKDEVVGKKTLAVRLGDRGARAFYVALIITPYFFAALTADIWSLLTLFTLPLALPLCKGVLQGATGRDLIPLLGKTGKYQLLFAFTFAIALAL